MWLYIFWLYQENLYFLLWPIHFSTFLPQQLKANWGMARKSNGVLHMGWNQNIGCFFPKFVCFQNLKVFGIPIRKPGLTEMSFYLGLPKFRLDCWSFKEDGGVPIIPSSWSSGALEVILGKRFRRGVNHIFNSPSASCSDNSSWKIPWPALEENWHILAFSGKSLSWHGKSCKCLIAFCFF